MKALLKVAAVAFLVAMPEMSFGEELLQIVPNFMRTGFVRANARNIDTIVLHSSYNSRGEVYSVDGLVALYRKYGVSAHYLIDRNGTIYQLVPESYLSYHAGESKMPDGRTGVNRFSIGIEIMNTREDTYTEAQYASVRRLVAELRRRYNIEHIVGHGEIAPERKSDPWNFDWSTVREL